MAVESMETPNIQRSQPSPLRQELRAQQRLLCRNAILDSSAILLDERGPDAVKVSDIADNAGISVGALYNYFKNKEELIAAVQRRSLERFLEHLQEPYDVNDHLLQLEEFLRRSLVWCERRVRIDSSRPGIFGQTGSRPSPQTILTLDCSVLDRYRELLLVRLWPLIKPSTASPREHHDEICWYLLLLMHAALTDWVQWSRPVPPSSKSGLLLKLFLRGISHQLPIVEAMESVDRAGPETR